MSGDCSAQSTTRHEAYDAWLSKTWAQSQQGRRCAAQVAKLQRACLSDPVRIEVASKYKTVDTLRQEYLFIPAKHKVGKGPATRRWASVRAYARQLRWLQTLCFAASQALACGVRSLVMRGRLSRLARAQKCYLGVVSGGAGARHGDVLARAVPSVPAACRLAADPAGRRFRV